MNYHNIISDDMNNGDGLRVTLFVSGCTHHCLNCHNPETWDICSGILFDKDAENELFDKLKPDWISGITFSGGDPLHPSNREEILRLSRKFKELFPNKTAWLYTGYEFEEIKNLEILEYLDVIVVGPFVDALKDVNYEWAGSTNQRVLRKTGYQWIENKKEE